MLNNVSLAGIYGISRDETSDKTVENLRKTSI